MRKLLVIVAVVLLLPIVPAGYLIWQNNRTVEAPPPHAFSASLEKSIHWLLANRARIMDSNSAILWWMIKESAEITKDKRLQMLFAERKIKRLDHRPNSIWQHLYDPYSTVPLKFRKLKHLPDYNLQHLYGLSCDEQLGKEESIQRQNEVDFCAKYHPISPACITHQLLGARFMQRRRCGDAEKLQYLINALQNKIITQLTWDPRVVDVYIQRVLMLTESGARERIKPVWLWNVLDAQLKDGGWSGLDPLVPISSSRYLCFTSRAIGIQQIKSSFHTTAQGVLLMSLLVSEARE